MNLIENHTEFLIIEIHHYVFIIFSDRFADNGIEKPFIILMKQQVYFVINRQMFDEIIVKGFFKRSVLVEQEQDIGHLTGYIISFSRSGIDQSPFAQIKKGLENGIA